MSNEYTKKYKKSQVESYCLKYSIIGFNKNIKIDFIILIMFLK